MKRMKGGKRGGGRKGGKKTGGLEGSWRERKREGGQEGGQPSRGQERVAEGREGREGAAERGRAGESWPGVVLWRRERVSGVCGSLPRARASLVLCVGEPSRCLVAPRIPGRGRACGGRAGGRACAALALRRPCRKPPVAGVKPCAAAVSARARVRAKGGRRARCGRVRVVLAPQPFGFGRKGAAGGREGRAAGEKGNGKECSLAVKKKVECEVSSDEVTRRRFLLRSECFEDEKCREVQ